MKRILSIYTLFAIILSMSAQPEVFIESQISASNGHTPLWLNANKYGLSSLNSYNGYMRAIVSESLHKDHNSSKWDFGYAADLVVPIGYVSQSRNGRYTSHLIIQQLYADVRYRNILLTIGSKQQPMSMRYERLSTGAQTLGINARPIPQVRLGLDEWWAVPGTRNWLSLMGHVAYGIMTDGAWEKKFAEGSSFIYNEQTRYHQKAGYLRIGRPSRFPLTFTAGIEMASQFGGYLNNWKGSDQNNHKAIDRLKLKSDLNSYWNAFVPGGSEEDESLFKNAEGNQVGSWVVRFDWIEPEYTFGIYLDHFFEDHSSMFFLDYDGYGTGKDWNTKKDFRFFLYKFSDFQLGIDIKLNEVPWLKRTVIEYIGSKYQSGPIYHDHNIGNPDHISGIDDYYNHWLFSGWQNYGQVIGNPLFRSPLYNEDGEIGTKCNRFNAWHFGAEGNIFRNLNYRVLCTFMKGYGTYKKPFTSPEVATNIMGELTYSTDPFSVTFAIGNDTGDIFGNNFGSQITIKYRIR